MSDESKKPTEQNPASPPRVTENPIIVGKTLSKSRPVKVYLTILFVVAILLLVMSFFMQQRSQQALEDLNASMSTSHSITDLQMDKQKLEFQLSEIQNELKQLKEDQATLTTQLDQKNKEAQALEWLRQIETACRSSYTKAKDLVEQFHNSGLESSLPTESVVEGGTSPAETYRNLYATLF